MYSTFLIITTAAIILAGNSTPEISGTSSDKNISGQINDKHNSQNSLDWAGVYLGKLPCADCESIQVEIRLNKNLTYAVATKYMGKSDRVYRSNGQFKWDKSGSRIIIGKAASPNIAADQYLVGENILIPLDSKGNKIQSSLPADSLNLKKVLFDDSITGKYWKLIELNGKKFALKDPRKKEPHFILKNEDNKVTGFAGCNSFNGSFKTTPGGIIKFNGMITTMKACLDVDYERFLLRAFNDANNYALKGDTLSLNKHRMAPLAKFVVVYLK